MQPLLVNPSEASEPLAQNCRQLLSNWPSLAGPVLVFYDYILMLPIEMHLIWHHPKPCDSHSSRLCLRHQVILVLLSVVGLVSLAIGVWLGTTTNATAPPPGSPCSVAGAWEAGLFRDVLIFGFTLLRGILHWRRADHSPCVDCFLITAVDVANILMYYPFLAGGLAWLASSLSAVLIARLMLNMREVVDTGVYGTDVGAIVSGADDESVVEWNIVDGIPLRQMGVRRWIDAHR
ncbi:hypothetical protein B0H14DRAFT_2762774, partial [Mycena olivaceomarginata]